MRIAFDPGNSFQPLKSLNQYHLIKFSKLQELFSTLSRCAGEQALFLFVNGQQTGEEMNLHFHLYPKLTLSFGVAFELIAV